MPLAPVITSPSSLYDSPHHHYSYSPTLLTTTISLLLFSYSHLSIHNYTSTIFMKDIDDPHIQALDKLTQYYLGRNKFAHFGLSLYEKNPTSLGSIHFNKGKLFFFLLLKRHRLLNCPPSSQLPYHLSPNAAGTPSSAAEDIVSQRGPLLPPASSADSSRSTTTQSATTRPVTAQPATIQPAASTPAPPKLETESMKRSMSESVDVEEARADERRKSNGNKVHAEMKVKLHKTGYRIPDNLFDPEKDEKEQEKQANEQEALRSAQRLRRAELVIEVEQARDEVLVRYAERTVDHEALETAKESLQKAETKFHASVEALQLAEQKLDSVLELYHNV
ncbi:uncharacterized protein BP01DRAFT_403347 [Aspergillus saccharolyticus JOP 1030-1]|uniref:Uncharacterized protein n=1 Tax=Aspergillus saccharolyticus JOP 1030-1 TaxID=1450539 RepID=A0A319AQW4_9EURO|nr:hypothetical protein BP01DRAFT_403347 [Aspergillus saccharolyticus JOP 1030-1]PYH48772.1 hypothetical protein BP01DRAFT_403347 [Aspergillus saccharolyticus JOP 1030-1]